MGRIIAVANQKGGVGKSTTAINLSACLAEKGKKVLAIDMDPQGNTTSGFGVDKNGIENTLYELLLGEAETKDTIVKDVVENLDLIPSNINLSGAEIELVGIDDKEFILKGITDKLRRKYDYIILDCPPSLNMLTINALTAATSVLVPIQCEYYALEGLSQLIHTIDLVKERLNKRLKMEGVVFTMYDARTNLSLQVVENVKENLNQNIYKTIIPRNVRLAEVQAMDSRLISMIRDQQEQKATGFWQRKCSTGRIINGRKKKRSWQRLRCIFSRQNICCQRTCQKDNNQNS